MLPEGREKYQGQNYSIVPLGKPFQKDHTTKKDKQLNLGIMLIINISVPKLD